MKVNRPKNDVFLIAAVIILLTIGLIMVFSASAVMAHEKHGSILYFSRKQVFWGFICIMSIFIFSRLKLSFTLRKGVPLYLVLGSFVMLAGLFIWGDLINGARRWYSLGFASFQPSEFARFALIIYFADILTRKGSLLHDWKKGLLPHVFILLMILIPIYLQPDLGTAIMIAMVIAIMIFLSNVRFKHIFAGLLFLVPAVFFKLQGNSYQLLRVSSWYNNLDNPMGSGYQIKQSLIGLGNGGIFGSGIGTSRQKFYFLPDSHTDFVFSILGEELGFIGTTVVLILFLVILWRGISIAKRANNIFAQFLAIGLTMNLVLYAMMNAAVASMLIPTTGLPMPFLSYGGSSLLFAGISVGILINISRNSNMSAIDRRYNKLNEDGRDLYSTLIMSR
jgi:cell division protein FtsW